MAPKTARIHQIKVSLNGVRPAIWRRVLVPDTFTLLQLHEVVQIAMGWQDYHLHAFTVDGQVYGRPEDDEYGLAGTLDETGFTLKKLLKEGARFSYEYDFGDTWIHTLRVEKVLPAEKGTVYPVCVRGRRACPPEDVGGIGGYQEFLDALADSDHPRHEGYLEWIGGEFDAETFDLGAVNERLQYVGKWTWIGDPMGPGAGMGVEPVPLFDPSHWKGLFAADDEPRAEALPLRRDAVALLCTVRDTKVIGTASTGNFPLKAVAEIAARFQNPPKLETKVGDRAYPIRSEVEVWPVFLLHSLAAVAGFLDGGQRKRWRLTDAGEGFLAAPVLVQVATLFAVWWLRTNWLLAFPFESMSEEVLVGFPAIVRERLLMFPAGTTIAFESFADDLIQAAGWYWPIEDQAYARRRLHAAVTRMVIDRLVDFGAAVTTRQPEMLLAWSIEQLVAFEITPFGRALLETLG